MSWKCRFIEHPEMSHEFPDYVDINKRAVGDIWWLTPFSEARLELMRPSLSDYYFKHNTQRPPIYVMLPGRNVFLIDGKCFDHNKGGYYGGWGVKGRVPLISVSPSINFVGRYHGHLVQGVISHDVEGRKFQPNGDSL